MSALTVILEFIVLASAAIMAIANVARLFGPNFIIFKKRKEKQDKEFKEKIRAELTETITPILQEIRDINLKQSEQINILTKSSKDILQESIMEIYHRRRRFKTLTIYDKEALEQYYEDYKAENGNHHIDKYYSRMSAWPVISVDEYDE